MNKKHGDSEELQIIKVTDTILDNNPEIKKASVKVLRNVLKKFKAKGGAILIFDSLKKELEVLAKKGVLKAKLSKECFKKGKTLVNKEAIYTPIEISGKIYGVLYVYGIKNKEADFKYLLGIERILDGRFRYEYDSEGLKSIFSKYIDDKVIKRVLKRAEPELLLGERHNCSVLFADINNFTSYVNTHSPENVIELLNYFFGSMSEIILRNEGTIDKFVGDSIMAVFGSPLPQKDHAKIAIRTAISMIKRMKSVQKKYHISKGGLSIGIATGKVVSGNVGYEKMMDYTIVGNKVNLASRLTSLAGGNKIYVDEATTKAAKSFKFKNLQRKEVKGLGSVHVFEVV